MKLFKKNYLKKNQLYGPSLSMGLNYLKISEPLRGGSLLFAIKSPGGPGTHLIHLGKMKS